MNTDNSMIELERLMDAAQRAYMAIPTGMAQLLAALPNPEDLDATNSDELYEAAAKLDMALDEMVQQADDYREAQVRVRRYMRKAVLDIVGIKR